MRSRVSRLFTSFPLVLGLFFFAGCASAPEPDYAAARAAATPAPSPWVGTWYDVFFESYAEPMTREQFRLRADGTGEYFHRAFLQPRRWVPIRWRSVAPDKIEFLNMPGNWVASATLNADGTFSYRVDRGNNSSGLGKFSKQP